MNTVSPVVLITADGVERTLRATLGARKRIAERFGEPNIQAILKKFGDGVLPEIAYCLMYDTKGNPPDITAAEMAESIDAGDAMTMLGTVLAAFSQGKISPKEAEAVLAQAQEILETIERQKLTGSTSGDSAESASDLPTSNSGMDISNARSMLLAGLIETKSIDEQLS